MKSQTKGDAAMNDDIKRPGNSYDLIFEEDRETLRWVKERGGLQKVSHELAYGREVSGRVGIALYGTEDNVPAGLTPCKLEEELRKRLMPEGYVWPRYEDGEPVRIGNAFDCAGMTLYVDSVQLLKKETHLWATNGTVTTAPPDERVVRPKVLAVDGEPLEVGQTVWGVETGQEYVVDAFVYDGSHGPYVVEGYYAGYNDVLHLDPSKLTHHQPKTRSANETAKGKHRVDRNALLTLADEMVSVIWWDADVENQMGDWAARIRKACDGCDE